MVNIEYASNNPRIRKQNKKAYFRITSVVDTVKNGSEDLSSKILEENKAKNSLDLENSAELRILKDVKSLLRLIQRIKQRKN